MNYYALTMFIGQIEMKCGHKRINRNTPDHNVG